MPDGVWGVCVPERTEVKLLSGLRLNATTDAGTQCADPCTPDCRTFPEATTTTIVSLQFGRMSDIFSTGLHEYLTDFLSATDKLGDEINRSFFAPELQIET